MGHVEGSQKGFRIRRRQADGAGHEVLFACPKLFVRDRGAVNQLSKKNCKEPQPLCRISLEATMLSKLSKGIANMIIRHVRLILALFLVIGVSAEDAIGGQRGYKIALGFPFPPWDVGPLEGVNFDLLSAICAANTGMRCKFLDRPFTDCVDSDAEGNLMIGQALANGKVDGCMGWFITPEREQLGAEFSHPYSRGPTPQRIARNTAGAFDGLGASGSLGGAEVGFLSGFFNDPSCLGKHYTDFSQRAFASDQVGRDSMRSDRPSLRSSYPPASLVKNQSLAPSTIPIPIFCCRKTRGSRIL